MARAVGSKNTTRRMLSRDCGWAWEYAIVGRTIDEIAARHKKSSLTVRDALARPDVREVVDRLRAQQEEMVRHKTCSMSDEALHTMRLLMIDPHQAGSVRARVALQVLAWAGAFANPDTGAALISQGGRDPKEVLGPWLDRLSGELAEQLRQQPMETSDGTIDWSALLKD